MLEGSGFKEFLSVNVRGKKLLEPAGFNCWGNEVVKIARSSVVNRRFKVCWQGDGDFMM